MPENKPDWSEEARREMVNFELGRKKVEEKQQLVESVLVGEKGAIESTYLFAVKEAFEKLEKVKPKLFQDKTPDEISMIQNQAKLDFLQADNKLLFDFPRYKEQDEKIQKLLRSERAALKIKILELIMKIGGNKAKELFSEYYTGLSCRGKIAEDGAYQVMGTMDEEKARKHAESLVETNMYFKKKFI